MSFSLTRVAPALRELSLTPTTLFLEAGRLSLYVNLWDTHKGKPRFEVEKHECGIGRTLCLGPITVEASWVAEKAYLPIEATA